MILPLGAGSSRKLFPVVTVALIAINCLLHLATLPRVSRDDARLGTAMMELLTVQLEIRAATGGGKRELTKLFGMRREDREDEAFSRQFEAGRIAPTDSAVWNTWADAKEGVRDAEAAHIYWQWGFRKDAPSPITMVSAAFLHGGWLHLLGNMLFLWIVGANMEEVWGRRTFLLLYILGILSSNLAVFLQSVAVEPRPGIGASGAIAAVMGAFMVRHFKKPIRVWSMLPLPAIYTLPAFVLLPAWFFEQLVAVSQSDANTSGVGYGVHVLGFVVGASVALALKVGGSEAAVEAPQEAERRRLEQDVHRTELQRRIAASDTRGAIEELRKLLAMAPDDHAARLRSVELHALVGDRATSRAEGIELLERTWRAGDRAEYSAAFARVDSLCEGSMPPGLIHRAAMALEASDPVAAGALYVRVAQQGRTDPILPQSLRRYAALLDRVGEPEKAAHVRALLERANPIGVGRTD